MELYCAACGGALADRPSAEARRPAKDPFAGKVIRGARLRKIVAVRPAGVVYRATHRQLRTGLRVEVFTTAFGEQNPAHMRLLFRRASLTGELRSRYVVSLLDLGRQSDCWYIITDFLPSGLRALLERGGRLPVNRVLTLAEDMLQGLVAVHGAGAYHGNVTPEGVLLGHEGSARLDRLGAVERLEELNRLVISAGGMVAGPALYLASERRGDQQRADIRSDLYSLGATLYEMLSGRAPYTGASAGEVLAKHAAAPMPDLRQARPDVPVEICEFIEWLLAKDPDERPQEPQEALDELRHLAVELSRQKKISPVKGAVTRAQRVRSAVKWTGAWTVVAAALGVMAVIPAVLIYQQRRRKQAIQQEVEARAPRSVLILLEGAAPSPEDPLPPRRAGAIRTLAAYRLAFYPELEVTDPLWAAELTKAGKSPEQVRQATGSRYLLTAVHTPGFERRNWALTFAGRRRMKPWWICVRCSVEPDQPDGLSALESALDRLLARAAGPLRLGPRHHGLPATGAGDAAWALMAEALRAEREGRLREALEHAEQAQQQSAGAGPFALLAAFYRAADHAREQGEFPAVSGLAAEVLPPKMAALSELLEALGAGERTEVEWAFGERLAQFPRWARGYFLLGLWWLYAEERPAEALVALRHATDVDPGYMPAARACVELLVRLRPEEVEAFLGDHREKVADKESAFRLRRYAEELLAAQNGNGGE